MDGGDERLHIAVGVELAEADAHGSFGKSPDGVVRRWGAMQPSAHGNPKLFVKDRSRERDVPAVEPKRDDSSARRRVAKDTDPIDLPQTIRQAPREIGLVLGDGVYADRSDEADPGGQPGDARQVEGSRLEPPGVLLGLIGAFRFEAGAALAEGLHG